MLNKPYFLLALCSLILLSCGGGTVTKTADGWQILFNGRDLDGWQRLNGGAEFTVEDDAIIGVTERGEPNTFLATKDRYEDFILELEFQGDPFINSGIQIRSNSTDYQKGRVHGYQVELDPSERAWSGGIYDESRRGWLYPMGLNPKGGEAFKPSEWNKIYVEAIGNQIKTWINDVPAAYLIDDMTGEGFIALQVHSVERAELNGRKMKWRNIRLKTNDLEPREGDFPYIVNNLPNDMSEDERQKGWIALFDGSDVNHWRMTNGETFPEKGWKVDDGELIATGGNEDERGGDIVTRDEFSTFEFSTEFMLNKAGNSGIKYFVAEASANADASGIGLEFQLIDNEGYADAHEALPANREMGSLYDMIAPEVPDLSVRPPGEWNHARIVVHGDNRVEHWLNNIKVLEYKRGSRRFQNLVEASKYKDYKEFGMASQGHILLQDHGDQVRFRSIKVRNIIGD